MGEPVAFVALIRREKEGQNFWLARWNPCWQKYHFVSGYRREDETGRQCLAREFSEGLAAAARLSHTGAKVSERGLSVPDDRPALGGVHRGGVGSQDDADML